MQVSIDRGRFDHHFCCESFFTEKDIDPEWWSRAGRAGTIFIDNGGLLRNAAGQVP
jgi:hypothetical protein